MVNINDPKLWKNVDWDEPELPELLKKSDTLIEQQQRGKRLKDIRGESWRENKAQSSRELAQDPEWQAAHKVGAEKRKQNPNFIKSMITGAAKRESNEEFKKKRAEKNRRQATDPDYLKSLNEGVARRNADPEYQKTLLKSAEEKLMRKGFILTPAGIHLRQPESAEANSISVGTLQKRIKNKVEGYRYISKEEYIILTGKEI